MIGFHFIAEAVFVLEKLDFNGYIQLLFFFLVCSPVKLMRFMHKDVSRKRVERLKFALEVIMPTTGFDVRVYILCLYDVRPETK